MKLSEFVLVTATTKVKLAILNMNDFDLLVQLNNFRNSNWTCDLWPQAQLKYADYSTALVYTVFNREFCLFVHQHQWYDEHQDHKELKLRNDELDKLKLYSLDIHKKQGLSSFLHCIFLT